MSNLNVGGINPLNKYKSIQDAINKSINADNILIKKAKEKIDHGILIKNNVVIQGLGKEKTKIILTEKGMIGFLISSACTFKDLTIQIPPQTNAVQFDKNIKAANVVLENVLIEHYGKNDNQSTFPSINGGNIDEILPIKLTLINTDIDFINIAAQAIIIKESKIGKLTQKRSQIISNNIISENKSDLSNIEFVNCNNQNSKLFNITSSGQLMFIGDFQIQGIKFDYLDQLSGKALKKELIKFSNPLKNYTLLSTNSFIDKTSDINISNVDIVKDSFYQTIEKPIFFNFNSSDVVISDSHIVDGFEKSDAVVSEEQQENITSGGSLSLKDVEDESEWIVNDTVLSSENSSSSLFIEEDLTNYEQDNEVQSNNKSALNELKSMIGLDSVKKDVRQLISTARIQHEMKRRGEVVNDDFSMHMVFEGNAGTGKTTIARLVAKALYENNVLKTKKFVEVGPDDLIADIVGGTAEKTKEKVNEAMNGVLFIDEAYGLDESQNKFASDVSRVLIKAMEDNRDKLVVIFAGYTDDMKNFFANSNQGYQSRISKVVDFPDYTFEDLKQMLILKFQKSNYKVDSDKTLQVMFEGLKKAKNLVGERAGNGRIVRDLVQFMNEHKNARLDKINLEEIKTSDLTMFKAEDVEAAVIDVIDKSDKFK